MKVAAVLLVCLAVVSADVFDEWLKECSEELGVSMDFMHDAVKGLVKEDPKCYSKCFFKKAGFIGASDVLYYDEVDIDKMKAEFPDVEDEENRPAAIKAIEKCINNEYVKSEDFCNKLFQMHKCYLENLKKN